VNELQKALRIDDYKSRAHGAGRLLRETIVLLHRFDPRSLATTWAQVDEEPWKDETDLLAAYVSTFGEGPPLIRARPRQRRCSERSLLAGIRHQSRSA
jgi:hypothetical protein